MVKIKGYEKVQCQKCSPGEYFKLIMKNRNFRLYLFSHLCQHCGDWFVRIAALVSVQRLAPGSATALSLIVMCRTIPELLVAPLGGILADTFDRKALMVKLDILAAISVFSFIYALKSSNVLLLYAATVVRSTISASYMPITMSIVPMLVSNPEDLKRASTLNGMVWSGMLVVGGVLAGGVSARFGLEACYYIDIVTYLISALIMSRVTGDYLVESTTIKKDNDQDTTTTAVSKKTSFTLRSFFYMNAELIQYIWTCDFGLLILLKATGCLIFGSADVLNITLSHIEGDESGTSRLMGRIYSCVGIGCMLGPVLANSTIVHGDKPRTLQLAILFGLVFMFAGWLGVARNISSFTAICAFTAVRAIGSSTIWLFSTLLLQNLTSSKFLGRVLGLDFCLGRVSETSIAFLAGRLEDNGRSNSEIAYLSSGIAGFMFVFWCTYHHMGYGAAKSKFNKEEQVPINGVELHALI